MGVGKSSLVKQVLHRVKDRNVFLGGMLFVQARGISTVATLIDEILDTYFKGIQCEKAKLEFLDEKKYDQKSVKQESLINFIRANQN